MVSAVVVMASLQESGEGRPLHVNTTACMDSFGDRRKVVDMNRLCLLAVTFPALLVMAGCSRQPLPANQNPPKDQADLEERLLSEIP